MELIITVPDDFDKSPAEVLADVVDWCMADGYNYVAQWATIATDDEQGTCQSHTDIHTFNDDCIGWRNA